MLGAIGARDYGPWGANNTQMHLTNANYDHASL